MTCLCQAHLQNSEREVFVSIGKAVCYNAVLGLHSCPRGSCWPTIWNHSTAQVEFGGTTVGVCSAFTTWTISYCRQPNFMCHSKPQWIKGSDSREVDTFIPLRLRLRLGLWLWLGLIINLEQCAFCTVFPTSNRAWTMLSRGLEKSF